MSLVVLYKGGRLTSRRAISESLGPSRSPDRSMVRAEVSDDVMHLYVTDAIGRSWFTSRRLREQSLVDAQPTLCLLSPSPC